MSGKIAQEFGFDPLAILGFGFIGLAFLMAILGFRALKEVIAAPDPKEDVVKLARLYLYASVGFFFLAGPLHLSLLWGQSTFAPKPVNLKISLINSTWDRESFGEVVILSDGEPVNLENMKPVQRAVVNGAVLQVQLEKVVDKIEKMQAQIQVVTAELENRKKYDFALPTETDPDANPQAGG